jgi:hypothetical protein
MSVEEKEAAKAAAKAAEEEQKRNMAAYKSDTAGSRLKLCCHPCLNWYLCTMVGHKFHVTECFCIAAFAVCVVGGVFVLIDDSFPPYIFSIGLCVYALISIAFVWDYVNVSSLAAIATRLEGIAKRGTLEAAKYSIINDSLEDQTATYKGQLGLLGETTTGIDVEIGNLNALIPKLEEMQEVHESLNKRQIELGDREEQFAKESQLAVQDKAKELIKAGVKVLFESFPKIPFRQGVTRHSADRVEAIREFLRSNGVPLTEELHRALEGKIIFCQDIVEYIDRELNTRFYRLKFAAETTRAKEDEVYEKRKELDKLKAKGHQIKLGILDAEDEKEIAAARERRKAMLAAAQEEGKKHPHKLTAVEISVMRAEESLMRDASALRAVELSRIVDTLGPDATYGSAVGAGHTSAPVHSNNMDSHRDDEPSLERPEVLVHVDNDEPL